MTAEFSGAETRQATLYYLSDDSVVNRRFVAPGAEINTGRYEPHEVTIRNARALRRPPTLDRFGFTLANAPSRVGDFRDPDEVERIYEAEVVETVKRLTGSDVVVPLGSIVRTSGDTSSLTVQPPASDVHVDMLPERAERLAARLAAGPEMGGRPYRRFIATSLWRAFSPPPQDWPLALCDARSVDPSEGVANVMINVDRLPEGEALFSDVPGEETMPAAAVFRYNPDHRFYFFPDMGRDEAILFKFHDSDGSVARRVPHTAFRDPAIGVSHSRESIEFRTVAFFL